MADTKLPEGTDTIIEGAGSGGASGGTSTGPRTGTTSSVSGTDALITSGDIGTDADDGSKSGIRGMISTAGTKARDEAATRARGFVGQGLTSGSATLGNIANIIEETVEQIGERLGPQYADYARSASQTINRYASTLENKDPDELVDDARELIRKSPGVALAGAAIVGFGLVRLIKAGIEEGQNGAGNRKGRRAS